MGLPDFRKNNSELEGLIEKEDLAPYELLDNAKKELIIELTQTGKKEKKAYLIGLAKEMDVSSRNFASINVYKIDKLAQKNKDKIFVVPGTVLAFGTIKTKVKVYAYRFSKGAYDKITEAKGEAKSLKELLKDKVEGKNILLVK